MNLLILEPHDVDDAGTARLDDARASHLVRVLRVTPGAHVRVGLLNGPLGTGLVAAVGSSSVTLHCAFEAASPPRPRVDVLLALPRPKVLRRLWPQFAALGVGRIMLTNAARVERNYFDTHVLEPACYRPLLIEGLQQARDTWLPEVSVHRRFRPLVEDDLSRADAEAVRMVADHRAQTAIRTALAGTAKSRALLAVGPEGGWTDFELSLLEQHGFTPVTLGPRTLRADTACIALLALVHEAVSEVRSC